MSGKGGKGGNRWKIVDYAEDYLKTTKEDAPKKARSIRQGLGGGGDKKPRKNPKGRGKLHYVEIWPKTQITMKRRANIGGRVLKTVMRLGGQHLARLCSFCI